MTTEQKVAFAKVREQIYAECSVAQTALMAKQKEERVALRKKYDEAVEAARVEIMTKKETANG